METWVNIFELAVGTVGCTEIIKNLINKGGKKVWTLITVFVGSGVAAVNYFLPPEVLHSIVGVSAGTIFYDTILKKFRNKMEKAANEN